MTQKKSMLMPLAVHTLPSLELPGTAPYVVREQVISGLIKWSGNWDEAEYDTVKKEVNSLLSQKHVSIPVLVEKLMENILEVLPIGRAISVSLGVFAIEHIEEE